MEVACGAENALKILLGELQCPVKPDTPEDLTKLEFVEQVLQAEAARASVPTDLTASTSAREDCMDLKDKELVSERYEKYKQKWEKFNN